MMLGTIKRMQYARAALNAVDALRTAVDALCALGPLADALEVTEDTPECIAALEAMRVLVDDALARAPGLSIILKEQV